MAKQGLKCANCRGRGVPVFNGYCRKCWLRPDSLVPLKGRVRCVVMYCENYSDQGTFIGTLCAPCFDFVSAGTGYHSQAYRNAFSLVIGRIGKAITSHLASHFDIPPIDCCPPSVVDREIAALVRRSDGNGGNRGG